MKGFGFSLSTTHRAIGLSAEDVDRMIERHAVATMPTSSMVHFAWDGGERMAVVQIGTRTKVAKWCNKFNELAATSTGG